MESSGIDTAVSTMNINQSSDVEDSAPSSATEFTTHQLQDASNPVGISQNTFSTVIDEFKILRELITNLTKESDETKSALIETSNRLEEKIKESVECLTKRLQDEDEDEDDEFSSEEEMAEEVDKTTSELTKGQALAAAILGHLDPIKSSDAKPSKSKQLQPSPSSTEKYNKALMAELKYIEKRMEDNYAMLIKRIASVDAKLTQMHAELKSLTIVLPSLYSPVVQNPLIRSMRKPF